MGDEPADATPATPATDDDASAGSDAAGEAEVDDSTDEDASDDDEDSEGEDDGSEEDEGDNGSLSAADLKSLLVDGGLEALCKKADVDPKILKINVPKFDAMRKGLKAARDLDAAATAKLTEADKKVEHADTVLKDAKQRYGALVDLKLAIKAKDWIAVRELCEGLAPEGTSWKDISEGIALAAKGMGPNEIRYRQMIREEAAKKEREAEEARAAEQKKKDEEKQGTVAARNLENAKKLLTGTDLDVPGAAAKLVELAAANWDPIKKGLKISKPELLKLLAKDEVVSGLVELKKLKSKTGKPKGEQTTEETPPVHRAGKKKPKTQAEQEEEAFQESIRAAARAEQRERAQTRRARR